LKKFLFEFFSELFNHKIKKLLEMKKTLLEKTLLNIFIHLFFVVFLFDFFCICQKILNETSFL